MLGKYLATSPEEELRTLNTAIVNIRKWLRKRHETLKYLFDSDSNKLIQKRDTFQKLITEAKKQQEGVDILLDRAERYLSVRANIVLEVDLENLVFLWNSYVENLKKLYTTTSDTNLSKEERFNSEKSEIARDTPDGKENHHSNDISSEGQSLEIFDNNNSEEKGILDRSLCFSESFSNQSCEDSGCLRLEDLQTHNPPLTVEDLVCEPTTESSHSIGQNFTTDQSPVNENNECEEKSSESMEYHSSSEQGSLAVKSGEMAESGKSFPREMDVTDGGDCCSVFKQRDENSQFSPVCTTPLRGNNGMGDSAVPVFCLDKEMSLLNDGFLKTEQDGLLALDSPSLKPADISIGELSTDVKRRRLFLETASTTSNLSSRSGSPLSLDSSRSNTPTGTLTRSERKGGLWKAFNSIDNFLMDKDIIEACKSTEKDLSSDQDDLLPSSVSFTEFLQQYRELTDWLNQVQKVTQREVTSLSEKYLNQSYHEEMLERSPRREFLNNYARQLQLRNPHMSGQITARMSRLNSQWTAVEEAIAPKHGQHDADTMLQDLECDLNTLRRWLDAVEAILKPLVINPEWTDAELEEKLRRHQSQQRDIESHNKIVNAVLKLSDRLERDSEACGNEKDRDSLQLVAINLERRWHGVWLCSLEWECRLEAALHRRKGFCPSRYDFSGFSLPVLDESLFGQSSHELNDQGLIELEDDSLLFIGGREEFTERSSSPLTDSCDSDLEASGGNRELQPYLSTQLSTLRNQLSKDCSADVEGVRIPQLTSNNSSVGRASGTTTPTSGRSPKRPSALINPDSPLGKRPFPDTSSCGEASPAKRGSPTPSSSSGGCSPVLQGSPVSIQCFSGGEDREGDVNKRGIHITSISEDLHLHNTLRVKRALFDRSSGDSANISEAESKMGDSPPSSGSSLQSHHHLHQQPSAVVTSSDGELDPLPGFRRVVPHKSEIKDIGYSSESQSNDEVEIMKHQIDLEYKFPGKCELASDGPLGEKISLPPMAAKPDYYYMTHVDLDSTDKTDNGDTTDSGPEKSKCELSKDATESDSFHAPVENVYSVLNDQDGSDSDFLGHCSDHKLHPVKGHFGTSELVQGRSSMSGLNMDYTDDGLQPMHEIMDFSESDSAPESKDKKSVRYLIEHAEELVKGPSPRQSTSSSPIKHPPTAIIANNHHLSPSKQTQTDTCSTVESSCDASGEDNSEHEGAKHSSAREDISTATDDADETIIGSIVNLDSATESARNTSADDSYSNIPQTLDSPRLRKQTGRSSRRQRKDRPWSVVGLQDLQSQKKLDAFPQVASSESAIDNLQCQTDTDSSTSNIFQPSHSSTFPRDHTRVGFHRTVSALDQPSNQSSLKHSQEYLASLSHTSSKTFTSTTLAQSGEGKNYVKTSESETSPYKGKSRRRGRRQRQRSPVELKETHRSSASTDSYDSAEAESESETADEYVTAPMEAATSDGDDIHNVSGSLSENSSWDNYQMLYPTASEDPGEELLAWEPQEDDLEFDDDFQMTSSHKQNKKSIISDLVTASKPKSKLRFTKQGMPCDDSDSDLEDFHHILDQSELQLKLADQSLRKKRKDPMGTGLHPDPAKYGEIMVTCETNLQCLATICRHISSENVSENDVKRVQDIMYQWEKLLGLASERHSQTTTLGKMREQVAIITANIQEAGDCLPFERFSSAEELQENIQALKDKRLLLDTQQKQIKDLQAQLEEFSTHHPTISVVRYNQELSKVLKSNSFMADKLQEHLDQLENNFAVWVEYLDGQKELDLLLAADRERLHKLLCQRENGLRITKKDVLKELETLQSNLSIYESKLSVLQAMRARLTRASSDTAQRLFLASLADLRNQLFVVSERCRQIYRDVEDDEELPTSGHTDLGKLAISSAALHEALKTDASPSQSQGASKMMVMDSPEGATGMSRHCMSWLRSLPVQVVALVLVAGLVCALDPDILDRLSNFSLTITPELQYINGPPTV